MAHAPKTIEQFEAEHAGLAAQPSSQGRNLRMAHIRRSARKLLAKTGAPVPAWCSMMVAGGNARGFRAPRNSVGELEVDAREVLLRELRAWRHAAEPRTARGFSVCGASHVDLVILHHDGCRAVARIRCDATAIKSAKFAVAASMVATQPTAYPRSFESSTDAAA